MRGLSRAVPSLLGAVGGVGITVQTCSDFISAENLHFDAAVLGAGHACLGFLYRPVRTQANHMNPVDRYVVLGNEIVNYGIGAAFTQRFIICLRSRGVGIALHRDEIALAATDVACEFVQILFAFLVQVGSVELEW